MGTNHLVGIVFSLGVIKIFWWQCWLLHDIVDILNTTKLCFQRTKMINLMSHFITKYYNEKMMYFCSMCFHGKEHEQSYIPGFHFWFSPLPSSSGTALPEDAFRALSYGDHYLCSARPIIKQADLIEARRLPYFICPSYHNTETHKRLITQTPFWPTWFLHLFSHISIFNWVVRDTLFIDTSF